MTNEVDRERMLDAIRSENFPTRQTAIDELMRIGRYNKGTAKAIDILYKRQTLRLKNGKTVTRTKKGQLQVRDRRGRVLHIKNNRYAIRQFKKLIEGKKKK